jgi:hypothetical protein
MAVCKREIYLALQVEEEDSRCHIAYCQIVKERCGLMVQGRCCAKQAGIIFHESFISFAALSFTVGLGK